MQLDIYTDGGSRSNPGPAGIGVYIKHRSGKDIEKRFKYLGEKTNNEAEYLGAYYGIRRAIELGATDIQLFMDSKLVIHQLRGEWKVKQEKLKLLHDQISTLLGKHEVHIIYSWIPREQNKEADRLSNVAMDQKD